MKKLLQILFILFWAINVFSQNKTLIEFAFPTENNEIVYKEVVSVDSTKDAKTLYLKAKEWIATKFKSAQDVIQMDNEKTIVIKSFIRKGHNTMVKNPQKWFTLKIDFKDGRYRYNLSKIIYEFDINHMGFNNHYKENFSSWLKYSKKGSKSRRKKVNAQLEKYAYEVNAEFEAIIESLKESMSNEAEDEW